MLDKFVYHSSEKSGLTKIVPRECSHRAPYVYAAKDKVISIVFMTRKSQNKGDLTYWKGRNPNTGKVAIVERYKDAFKNLYDGVSGSVYVLPSDSFIEGKTQWNEEVVSEQIVIPVEEIRIENIFDYLLELQKNGLLEMYEYPNRPKCIPKDDADLIRHALRYGTNSIKRLKELHPHLENRINALADRGSK